LRAFYATFKKTSSHKPIFAEHGMGVATISPKMAPKTGALEELIPALFQAGCVFPRRSLPTGFHFACSLVIIAMGTRSWALVSGHSFLGNGVRGFRIGLCSKICPNTKKKNNWGLVKYD
jgi:hypothetical protein